jgi:hypothetical protein
MFVDSSSPRTKHSAQHTSALKAAKSKRTHVCWLTVLSRELEHTEDDDGSRLRGPQDAC